MFYLSTRNMHIYYVCCAIYVCMHIHIYSTSTNVSCQLFIHSSLEVSLSLQATVNKIAMNMSV